MCGCPWSLSGCQGNFFLWVTRGARDSWLAIAWLWPCARTADVQVLMTHHPKRRLCQLYLVLWCMDVLFISTQLSLMLHGFLFSGLSYSAQTSRLQFPFNSAVAVVGWLPASTALRGRIALFSITSSDSEHKNLIHLLPSNVVLKTSCNSGIEWMYSCPSFAVILSFTYLSFLMIFIFIFVINCCAESFFAAQASL